MPTKRKYTITDNAGFSVTEGDQVQVSFAGTVREVTREGFLILRLANGTIAHFDPGYQGVVKIHK